MDFEPECERFDALEFLDVRELKDPERERDFLETFDGERDPEPLRADPLRAEPLRDLLRLVLPDFRERALPERDPEPDFLEFLDPDRERLPDFAVPRDLEDFLEPPEPPE